jgi:hypothetical protein
MTKRECDAAAEQGGICRIQRVLHFRNEVKVFDIAPPLQTRLQLTPATFMAAPRWTLPLSTVREDDVREGNVGLWADTTARWTDWLRTTMGIREDYFAGRVVSGTPANSGSAPAAARRAQSVQRTDQPDRILLSVAAAGRADRRGCRSSSSSGGAARGAADAGGQI